MLAACLLAALAASLAVPPQARSQTQAASSVRVKFTDESVIRLAGQRFKSNAGTDVTAVNEVLDRYAARRVRRLFVRAESELDRDRDQLERRSGRKLKDLNAYFVVEAAADRIDALAADLQGIAVVEAAYRSPEPAPPPATADFTAQQGYGNAAPGGIDTGSVATVPGAQGDRVKVLDIEYSWNRQHEDLTKLLPSSAYIPNGTARDHFNSTDHGTAVLGQLVADRNGFGVTGLVPAATPRLVNADTVERGYDLANAISLARQHLAAGDVMLIEQQTRRWAGDTRYVPVEWVSEWYDAITHATAAGIIVVEAAGNGWVDLDTLGPQPFPNGRPDSGAIIAGGAGAGCAAAPARSRQQDSTFGTRVELQGWAECVTTTGYGSLSQVGPNSLYTSSFSGTSSASPIVAAAAAALSSAHIAKHGRPPSPAEVRSVLRATGTPQDTTSPGALAGNIGPQPNLKAAFAQMGLVPPPVEDPSNLVRNPSFETDVSGWGSAQATVSRVAYAGAPHGSHVAQASWRSGTTISLNDALGGGTPTVGSTTAGTTYVATGHLRAAAASSAGKRVDIVLRESTPSGTTVKDNVVAHTLGSSFVRTGVSATAVGTGNTMSLRVVYANAVAGNAFQADLMTVRKGATVAGTTTAGSVWTGMGFNSKRASRYAFSTPGTVDVASIRAYVDGRATTSGSQPVRGVLYADASGAPGALVARTAELSIVAGRAAGWVTLRFASPVRLTAGSYWIGLHSGGSKIVGRYAASTVTGGLRFNGDGYSDGTSNPFGTPSVEHKQMSVALVGG